MRESLSAAMEYPLLRWCNLLLLAVGFICSRTTSAFPVKDSNPLFEFSDHVRLRHLYTANENTHMHLQITSDGEVSGSKDQNPYSLLEIKAVKPGILVIRGKKSSLYLCMDHSGHLYGSVAYKEEDCNLREVPKKDGLVLYFSEKHRAPLALQPPRGAPLTKFLPRKNEIPLDWLYERTNPFEAAHERTVDGGSEDPLNMRSFTNFGHAWE